MDNLDVVSTPQQQAASLALERIREGELWLRFRNAYKGNVNQEPYAKVSEAYLTWRAKAVAR